MLALVPCPSASPCLTLSSHRLLSLARQRLPSPAVIVAAGSSPLPISVHPRLPLLSPPLPPVVADAPGRSSPSAAALAIPPPPLPSHQPLSSSAATIIVATKPSSPAPPPISCFLGNVPFHIKRNHLGVSQKQKSVIYMYIYLGLGSYQLTIIERHGGIRCKGNSRVVKISSSSMANMNCKVLSDRESNLLEGVNR